MKHYNSLEKIPVYNYFQILLTGNLAFLYVVEESEDYPDKFPECFAEIWNNIYYSQKKMIIGREMKQDIELQLLKIKYHLTKEPRYLTRSQMLEFMANKADIKDDFDLDDLILSVEQGYDFKLNIDKHTYPAAKFLNLLDKLNKRHGNKTNS